MAGPTSQELLLNHDTAMIICGVLWAMDPGSSTSAPGPVVL